METDHSPEFNKPLVDENIVLVPSGLKKEKKGQWYLLP